MQTIPENLRYTESHEWVSDNGDGTITVGITHHAQDLLGDVVYVDLPKIDTDVKYGQEAGVIESVKSASDLYSPIDGKVVNVNKDLDATPELVNTSPYDGGWLFKLAITDRSILDSLLTAENYAEFIQVGT